MSGTKFLKLASIAFAAILFGLYPFVHVQAITGFQVQQTGAHGFDGGGGTTITCAFGDAPALGDTVAVGIEWFDGSDQSSTILSVKDSNNNVYTVTPNSPAASNGTQSGAAYLAYLLNAPANASNVITTTFGTPFAGAADMYCDDFSVNGGTAAFDHDAKSGAGGGGSITVPIIPVSGTNELLYSVAGDSSAINSINSPWSVGGATPPITPDGSAAAYITSASTNIALNMTTNGGDVSDSMGMSFSFTSSSTSTPSSTIRAQVVFRGGGTVSGLRGALVKIRGGGGAGSLQMATFVQSATGTCVFNSCPNGATSTISPSAGDLLMVTGQLYAAGTDPTPVVTDNASGGSSAYTCDVDSLGGAFSSLNVEFVCRTCSVKSGVTAVHVGYTSSTFQVTLIAGEYAGVSRGSCLDQATAVRNTGTSATAASDALTPAQSGELSIGWFLATSGHAFTGTNGWTCINADDASWNIAQCYKNISNTNSTTATASLTSADWDAYQALYLPGASSRGIINIR